MRMPRENLQHVGWTYSPLDYIEEHESVELCNKRQRGKCWVKKHCSQFFVDTESEKRVGGKRFSECRKVVVKRWRLAREAHTQGE